MGYYIEVTECKGKAKQLRDLYGGEILDKPPRLLSNLPPGKALICVVDNGPFEVACFCHSEREFTEFLTDSGSYQRPRQWVVMDLVLAEKLTCYRG